MSNYCFTSNGIRFAYVPFVSLTVILIERRGGFSDKTTGGGRWFTTTKGANVDVIRISCFSTPVDTEEGNHEGNAVL